MSPAHWASVMGGAEYQAKLLAEVLTSKRDAEVVYLASRGDPADSTPACRVRLIGKRGKRHRYGSFWDRSALLLALAEEQPDLIYQRVACAYTGICARYAERTGTPLIWHVANEPDCRPDAGIRQLLKPHKLLEKAWLEYGIRRATMIIAQTQDQAELLRVNYGRTPAAVIPNFHPPVPMATKPAGPLQVAWIANLKRTKRPELFLELAARFTTDPALRFVMVGAPYGKVDRQAAFVRQLSRALNVTYAGLLTQESIHDLLAQSHVLVNTSCWEGFSNAFIQAWLNGVPILSLGVNPDGILDDPRLGRCCATIDDMAEYLRRLASQPRSGGGSAYIREFALQRFSMSNAERLAQLLLDTAESHAASARALSS